MVETLTDNAVTTEDKKQCVTTQDYVGIVHFMTHAFWIGALSPPVAGAEIVSRSYALGLRHPCEKTLRVMVVMQLLKSCPLPEAQAMGWDEKQQLVKTMRTQWIHTHGRCTGMAGYPQRLPDDPVVYMLKYSEQFRAAYKEEARSRRSSAPRGAGGPELSRNMCRCRLFLHAVGQRFAARLARHADDEAERLVRRQQLANFRARRCRGKHVPVEPRAARLTSRLRCLQKKPAASKKGKAAWFNNATRQLIVFENGKEGER